MTESPRPRHRTTTDGEARADARHTGRTIDAEVTAATTPDRAWEAWADPEKIAGWFVDRAEGDACSVGNVMTWFFDRFGIEMPYRVIESVPGERIVFGPGSADMPPFLLEVILTRDGGDTRIRVVNSGFSEDADFDEQFAGMDSGWRMALGVLKEYLEHYFGTPRRTFMALRPAPGSPDDVRPWFVEVDRLGRWFATSGGAADLTRPGQEVRLGLVDAGPAEPADTPDAGTLTGTVLALTDREVALSWTEVDGVCELKAFSQGPQPMLCIRGSGWGMSEADARALEARMDAALGRLSEAMGAG